MLNFLLKNKLIRSTNHRNGMLNYILQLEKWKDLNIHKITNDTRLKPTNTSTPDKIKCYVTFPNENQSYNNNSSNNEKTPVILLFGWAGSQDRYLVKYSKIYEDQGWITLRYIGPLKNLFWMRQQLFVIGQNIIQTLIDNNLKQNPIFVHCFSNGGAFVYHGFSKALESKPESLKVQGVIFDSAPGGRVLGLFRATSEIIGGNAVINYPISSILTAVYVLKSQLIVLKNKLCQPENIGDSFEFIRQQKNCCPQHFIYSKADKLVFQKDVEDFIAVRKSLGVQTSFTRFDSSPHVQHFKYNRNEYISSVLTFIKKCIK